MSNKDKPRRNEPCSCGSGKKFKKCCLPWAREERQRKMIAQRRQREENATLHVQPGREAGGL